MAYDKSTDRIEVRFGRNLKAARLKAGLTRQEVAARAGLALDLLIQIECGTADPDLLSVSALAKAVGYAASELL